MSALAPARAASAADLPDLATDPPGVAVRPARRRVRGTRLEFRRVPWWLARYLAGPGGAAGELVADLAQIAARVRAARAAQAGPKGSAPRLSPGPLPGSGSRPADSRACDI